MSVVVSTSIVATNSLGDTLTIRKRTDEPNAVDGFSILSSATGGVALSGDDLLAVANAIQSDLGLGS